MAYDASTDRRIQRMSCQKVAVEVMAPFPVTSKGEPAAAAASWKKVFVELCDFLNDDVNKAGEPPAPVVATSGEPATFTTNDGTVDGPTLTLDLASKLTDRIQEKSEGNDVLRNAIKLQFVKFGIKPGPLLECVCQLTKPQADELVELVNKED